MAAPNRAARRAVASARSLHRHDTPGDALARQLASAAAQVAHAELAEDVAAGRVPSWARRGLFAHELTARVSFAALDRYQSGTVDVITDRLVTDRTVFLDLLADDLDTTPDVVARLLDLDGRVGLDSIAGAADLFDTGTADFELLLRRHALNAGAVAAQEALAQGVALTAPTALPNAAAEQVRQLAGRLATGPHVDVVRALREFAVAAPAGTVPADLAGQAIAHGRSLAVGPLEGYAATSVASADGLGRQATAAQATAPLKNVYASELLDSSTCSPCSLVDGRDYGTDLTAARADYPNGTYRLCEGGLRCRGTLVYVWGDEAAPTVDDAPRPDPTLLPPPPVPAPAPVPRNAVEVELAATLDVDVETVRELREEYRQVRRAARTEAATTQETALGLGAADELDAVAAPPFRTVVRRRAVGPAQIDKVLPDGSLYRGGEYDWLEALHPDELKRLRRSWIAPRDRPGVQGPEQIFPRLDAGPNITGAVGEGDFDAGLAVWLDRNRRADAAGALARGKLPSPNTYGGTLDANDLIPELHADGWDVDALFGDETTGLAHVLEVRRHHAELWAERDRADLDTADALAPEAMTFEDWQADLADTLARLDAGDDLALDRLAQLIPPDFADVAEGLTDDQLHRLIVETRRRDLEF